MIEMIILTVIAVCVLAAHACLQERIPVRLRQFYTYSLRLFIQRPLGLDRATVRRGTVGDRYQCALRASFAPRTCL